MTRLRKTNLRVFIQCQHTRTILRNENIGQGLLPRNTQNSKNSMKYSAIEWQDLGC